MLLRNSFAILAPVAVVYDGGSSYFGGASSKIDGLLSNVTAMAGIVDDPVLVSVCLLFTVACAVRSDRDNGYLWDRCDELIGGRYSN